MSFEHMFTKSKKKSIIRKIFTYEGKQYQAVEEERNRSCQGCCFFITTPKRLGQTYGKFLRMKNIPKGKNNYICIDNHVVFKLVEKKPTHRRIRL